MAINIMDSTAQSISTPEMPMPVSMASAAPQQAQGGTAVLEMEPPAQLVEQAAKAPRQPRQAKPRANPRAVVTPVCEHQPHPLVPDFQADPNNLAGKITANLWSVAVIVRRPCGSFKIPGAEVSALNQTIGKTTKPGFIVDEPTDHVAWADIDASNAKIQACLERYSILDTISAVELDDEDGKDKKRESRKRKGFHLVPASRTGGLFMELRVLRRERQEAVKRLADDYGTWTNNLRQKYPNHYHLLEPLLPTREQLTNRFDVLITAEEMTPITGDRLKLEDLNDVDRAEIRGEANKAAKAMIKARAKAVYDQVFGCMLRECESIATGTLQTGTRKISGIRDLTEMVERLKNFSEFIPADVCTKADDVILKLNALTDISDLNANEGENQVSAAITAAFKPLGESLASALKQISVEGGKARRRLR